MVAPMLTVIYAVAQTLFSCLPPVPLSHEVLASDKYLGKWYFVGVASWEDEDIAAFQNIDNSVVEWKKGANNNMIMAGALREGDKCVNTTWTYTFDEDIGPVMREGTDHLGLAFDGSKIKCPNCFMILKIHPTDGFLRVMLFSRDKDISADVVTHFKSRMDCYPFIDKYVMAPRNKEFCELQTSQ